MIVDLDLIEDPHTASVRDHRVNDALIAMLAESMRTIGLQSNVTLANFTRNGKRPIIAGNARVAAARKLGWTWIAADILDEVIDDASLTEHRLRQGMLRND